MQAIDSTYLYELAREKSFSGRRALADTISDLFSESSTYLTERERTLMYDILRQLVRDTEVKVREIISSRLADWPHAPVDLIEILANDEIEVAFPILTRSKVLRDEHLVEVIRHRTLEHRLAVANRQNISEPVSDALVATGDCGVIRKLLENSSANISRATMAYLVEQSQRVDTFQEPILRRGDLDPVLVKRMFVWVSAALRQYIVDNHKLCRTEVDQMIAEAINEEERSGDRPEAASSKSDILVSHLEEEGAVTPELAASALKDGEVRLFLSIFRRLTGLRELLIMRMLYEPGGEGLAIACKAIGMNVEVFGTIFTHSTKIHSNGTCPNSGIDSVMEFYKATPQEAAVGVLHRWQMNADYLAAIRELECA